MFDFFKKKDENKPQKQQAAQEQSEKKSIFSLTFESLKKTIENTSQSLVGNVVKQIENEEEFDEFILDDMEELLIKADLGVNTASGIVDKLRKQNKMKPSRVREYLQNEFSSILTGAGSNELNFKDNELNLYFIVGVNGAGKTTLIRLICGLQEPTSGDYVLYGKKHIDKDITKSRRRMGAIVETPSIYVDLTAYENLKEQYKVLGIPSDDGISEILKLVGLENTGNKKAKNFSLGMRQRLGIAVALAGSPDFLVLDEPVNGLDPQGIIEIRELILKLNQEHGITVLISSHILDELSKLATYYGFIDNGKMIKQISSIELESKCRKCTHLKVSSTKTLAYVLDTMNIEYKILSNTEADIFEKVNISKLTTELSKKDCEVISIHEHDESLESYFVSLVGGARHE